MKIFNVVGINELEGEIFSRHICYDNAQTMKERLETELLEEGLENVVDIIPEEIEHILTCKGLEW